MEMKKLFDEVLAKVKNSKGKGILLLGVTVVGVGLLSNTMASPSETTIQEKSVTESMNMGDAKILDTDGVTYEIDNKKNFEVIVMYKNETGRKYALTVGKEVEQESDLSDFNIIVIKTNENGLKKLQQFKYIEYVERNVLMEIDVQASHSSMLDTTSGVYPVNSNEYAGWGYEYMNIQEAYKKGITGKGVKVAVADSGVADHSDIKVKKQVIIPDNKINLTDNEGHGSHVAGIIAASDNNQGAIGIAPDVDLYSLKLDNDEGKISSASFLNALKWAVENDIDVFNASLSFNLNSPIYQSVINQAYEQGLIVVAASGNDGAENILYPAAYDNVVAVGAVKDDGERDFFSNMGDTLDFVAPGRLIASLSNDGGYIANTGTSMSSPHVAGLLALIMQEFPNKDSEWYYEALKDMSVDLDVNGFDKKTGYGVPKYNPEQINADDDSKEEVVEDVSELSKNQQRYYKLVEAYLRNIDTLSETNKQRMLDLAEKYMSYIDTSVAKDELLEVFHKNGRFTNEPYSDGTSYKESTKSSINDLTAKEREYYELAESYIADFETARTEKSYNSLRDKVAKLIAKKLPESEIRDVLLRKAHGYGAALDIPYSDGTFYNGSVKDFEDKTIQPTPQNPTPINPIVTAPESTEGKETSVSQLPATQQVAYESAMSLLDNVEGKGNSGLNALNRAERYLEMINESPIRDVLLRRFHEFGRFLEKPYSTGLYYFGSPNRTPWLTGEEGKTNPTNPVPQTPEIEEKQPIVSNPKPSIPVSNSRLKAIEQFLKGFSDNPTNDYIGKQLYKLIMDLPDSVERDNFLNQFNAIKQY